MRIQQPPLVATALKTFCNILEGNYRHKSAWESECVFLCDWRFVVWKKKALFRKFVSVSIMLKNTDIASFLVYSPCTIIGNKGTRKNPTKPNPAKNMPSSPTYMKARGKKAEESIGQTMVTKEERVRAKKEKEEKEGSSAMGPWVLGLLMFVVLGSSFLQIITNIQTSPSMSEEH